MCPFLITANRLGLPAAADGPFLADPAVAPDGVLQIGPFQLDPIKPGFKQVGFFAAGILQVGSFQVGSLKVGPQEIGTLQVGSAKVRSPQVSPPEVAAGTLFGSFETLYIFRYKRRRNSRQQTGDKGDHNREGAQGWRAESCVHRISS